MSLRSLNLPPLLNTSDHDLIQGFCAPCLAQALRCDRGVGCFPSGWLRLASQGMAAGAARLCYNAGRPQELSPDGCSMVRTGGARNRR